MSEKSIEGIVNIGQKPVVERRATARGRVHFSEDTKTVITSGGIKKGDVFEASTIAAIQAVKDTPRIIPHCHPIPLEGTTVDCFLKIHHAKSRISTCVVATFPRFS